jgi:hypothetical protein
MRINEQDRSCGLADGKCSICGEASAAFWHGDSVIEVCVHCALTILPALIADAVPVNESVTPYSSVSDIEHAFYRAMSIRLWRERKPVRDAFRSEN